MNSEDFFTWSKLITTFEKYYPSTCLDQDIPALYVSGERDRVFLKEVKEYCNHSKRSRLYVLENSGHVCNIDDPQSFNQIMSGYYDFLSHR